MFISLTDVRGTNLLLNISQIASIRENYTSSDNSSGCRVYMVSGEVKDYVVKDTYVDILDKITKSKK